MDARFAVLLLVPVLVGAFLAFDQVVRWQYARHRAAWERDGARRGLLWKPPPEEDPEGRRPPEGCSAPGPWLMLGWACRTPAWAAGDPVAVRRVWWLRALVVAWNAGVLALIAGQLLR